MHRSRRARKILWGHSSNFCPSRAQAPNPAIDKYVSDLFEGNQNYGNLHKNIARKAFKEIKDDQLKEHIIQTCKTVFPEDSGKRAELLDILYKNQEQIIHIFIDNLERNKEYIRNIQKFLPRMEACKVLLLGETASVNSTEKEPSYRGKLRMSENPHSNETTPFSLEQLSEITSCSRLIYSQTEEKDVVVFLGRSPLWLAEFWKYKNVDRNFFTLAFSGRPFNYPGLIPAAEQLKGYRTYLNKLGFTTATNNLKGKFIVVDYSDNGSSICCFYKTLNTLSGQFYHRESFLNKFTFYHLTSPRIAESTEQNLFAEQRRHMAFFNVTQIIMDPNTLIPIANCFDEESLGVHFPYSDWNQVDPLAHIPSEKAFSLQKQLHQYWENVEL